MFNASLQETLARYSDPSRNPYTNVFRSQTSEPSSSQHPAQTLHPGLGVSFGVTSANQWRLHLKLDIEAPEQPVQVLDSRGFYIQLPTLRTHTQPCTQQVLPEHVNFVASSRRTGEELANAVPAPTHDAANVIHKQFENSDVTRRLSSESHVPPRFWSKYQSDSESTNDITSVVPPPASTVPPRPLASYDNKPPVHPCHQRSPASTVSPSASGSHVDPIVTADKLDASSMPEISRPANVGNATAEKEKGGTDEREAEGRDSERMDNERTDAERTDAERMETERMENEGMETLKTERMKTKRHESATREAEPKREPRASTTTNTTKLLRMERKLNNKDLFMGWLQIRECIRTSIPS
ncbi:uncharacterized protein EDB91DRAFT_343105 [Suillus paluster]|uniref:uncharacterized protein n=1 Tax=Suillus paluster TaxID=48578 RepID=UPI001B8773F1|nr:uncharacterized protein EDB91DRAFT_343105 [Suillus paluster]KAG1740874.1 hypothetical protein EDB91DRAFT_343105 [Suillus paluster]